jgi:hypothetical protein
MYTTVAPMLQYLLVVSPDSAQYHKLTYIAERKEMLAQ